MEIPGYVYDSARRRYFKASSAPIKSQTTPNKTATKLPNKMIKSTQNVMDWVENRRKIPSFKPSIWKEPFRFLLKESPTRATISSTDLHRFSFCQLTSKKGTNLVYFNSSKGIDMLSISQESLNDDIYSNSGILMIKKVSNITLEQCIEFDTISCGLHDHFASIQDDFAGKSCVKYWSNSPINEMIFAKQFSWNDDINAVKISPYVPNIVAAGTSKKAILIDFKQQRSSCKFRHFSLKSDVLSVELSSDGNYLLSGCRNGKIKIFDLRQSDSSMTLPELSRVSSVYRIKLNKESDLHCKYLISQCFNGDIALFDLRFSKTPAILYTGHTNTINQLGMAINKDFNVIAAVSHDKKVNFWSLLTGDLICCKFSTLSQGPIRALEFLEQPNNITGVLMADQCGNFQAFTLS